jgi:hypothetical protein
MANGLSARSSDEVSTPRRVTKSASVPERQYLGFGAIMGGPASFSACLAADSSAPLLTSVASHIPSTFSTFLGFFCSSNTGRVSMSEHMFILAYVAGAIVVGIVTSKLVEIPVPRLRERLFEDQRNSLGWRERVAASHTLQPIFCR